MLFTTLFACYTLILAGVAAVPIPQQTPRQVPQRVPQPRLLVTSNHPESDVGFKTIDISLDANSMNSGFSTEANIIFSQDSYIPRMLSGNLTIQAYGRSYNLFEVGLNREDFVDIFTRMMRAARSPIQPTS
ncbi:unnamed protein product [Rhizoctonia solani]|uniref:Vitellinogen open beta-sheet domain-containing protein n=1 Tax=Rhizoctonia solani TaxID=456999 RepID=A0A8H3HQA0_9AGAM|nr:unnamed protein product [Rhizoctonia solani]